MNLFDLYASLTLDTSDYSSGLKTAASDTTTLTGKTDKLDDSLDDIGSAAKDDKNQLDNMAKIDALNTLGDAADSVVDKIKEIGESAIESANDIENSSATASAYLGETGEAAEATEDLIKSVYENGWGDSLDQVSEAVITVKENLGDLNDTELEDVVTQALALESTGVDMSESMRGVNSLMEQYGLTAEEAMDLYVSGVNNGLNKTDELGDNISEYAGTFADAGYSAEEYFQLLQNGADNGAYNLDKVNDAINEATTRLEDGTIEESMDMFSDSTAEVFQAWQKGEATEKDVIESIVKDINNAESEQDALNMAAEAFGTMGEDGSLKFISSLTAVGDTYSDVEGASSQFTDTLSTDASTLEGNNRALQDAIAPLGEIYQSALTPVVGALADIVSAIMAVVSESPALQAVIVAVTAAMIAFATAMSIKSTIQGVSTAMKALNVTMSANPFMIVVTAIAALVAAVVYLWNNCEAFREGVLAIWNAIKTGIPEIISTLKDLVVQRWNEIGVFIEIIVTAIKTTVTNIWNAIKTAVTTVITTIQTTITNVWTAISTTVKSLVTGIKTTITTIFTTIKTKISTILTGIKTTFTNIWTAIKTTANTLVTGIKTTVVNIVTAIKTKISTILTNIKTVFSNAWTSIKTTASTLVANIKTTVVNIITAIKTKISSILEGIKTKFSNIWTSINTKASTLVTNIKTTVVNIVTAIKTKISSILNGIKTKFTDIWTSIKTKVTTLVTKLKTSVVDTVTGIKTSVSSIISAIKTKFTEIFSGIKEKVMTILTSLTTKIKSWGTSLKSSFLSIGKNLILGLWNGISDKVDWVISKIKSLGESVIKAAKSIFGISSPSKVFAEIGGYLAEGLGKGWEDEIEDVKAGIENDLDFGTVAQADSALGLAGSASGTGGVTVVQNIYSKAQTAADLLKEARWNQEKAVLRGVYV